MSATETAAQAALTGTSALFVAALGVEPQAVIWSFVGCIIGVTLAKPAGRFYAILMFIAATLTCALCGTLTAELWLDRSVTGRNVCAVVYGVIFHPAVAALIGMVPGTFDAIKAFVVRRIGG